MFTSARRWRISGIAGLLFVVISFVASAITNQGDEIADRAEFCVGPRSDDDECRDDKGARTNRPPAQRPDEQGRSSGEKEESGEQPNPNAFAKPSK